MGSESPRESFLTIPMESRVVKPRRDFSLLLGGLEGLEGREVAYDREGGIHMVSRLEGGVSLF